MLLYDIYEIIIRDWLFRKHNKNDVMCHDDDDVHMCILILAYKNNDYPLPKNSIILSTRLYYI